MVAFIFAMFLLTLLLYYILSKASNGSSWRP
jgi:hypothetical protein